MTAILSVQTDSTLARAVLASAVELAGGAAPVSAELGEAGFADAEPADAEPDTELGNAASAQALQVPREQVLALDPKELRASLDRILLSRHPDLALEALMAAGIFAAAMPEVTEIVGLGDGDNQHKDVWKHTKQVVLQSVPRLAVRWAALLHDIGKPRTKSVAADGKVQFLHHPEVGARMFDKMDRRLGLFKGEEALKERIRFLVVHHQRAHQYESSWTESAIRRFGREIGDCLDDLVALSRADMTTKRKEKRRRFMFQLKELTDRIEAVQADDAVIPPLPKGLGDDITRAFGIPPSRKIGDIKKLLEAAVDAGEVLSHQPSEYYVEVLSQNRERYLL